MIGDSRMSWFVIILSVCPPCPVSIVLPWQVVDGWTTGWFTLELKGFDFACKATDTRVAV